MHEAWLILLVASATVGCSRSNPEIYCEEVGKCWDLVSPGDVSQGAVDECVDRIEEDVEGLSDAEREELERPIEACAAEEDCAFVVCLCDNGALDGNQLCDPARKHL